MGKKRPTRKELRKRQRALDNFRHVKKGSAIVGTALVSCSVVAPVVLTERVDAAEQDSSVTSSQLNHDAFINQLVNEVQPIASQHGYAASRVIAQAIVDSNWGTKEFAQAPYYNLFGLEGKYNGNSVNMLKEEVQGGRTVQAAKELKVYSSYQEAIEDFILYLNNTAAEVTPAVQAVISDYNLTRFDQAAPVAQAETPATPQQYYTVETGDTIQSISNDFDITTNNFVSWNNLDDQAIYPGQDVVVHESAAPTAPADVNLTTQTAPVAAPVAHTPAPVTEVESIAAPEAPVEATTPEATPVVTERPMQTPEASTPETTPVETEENQQPVVPEVPAETPPTTNEEVAQPEVSQPTEETQPEVAPPAEEVEQPQQPEVTPPAEETVPPVTEETPVPETPVVEEPQQPETPEQPQQPEVTPPAVEEPQQPEVTPPVTEENNGQTPTDPSTGTNQGQAIVDAAAQQVGKPYVWGAKGPDSFDCSGLTQYVYQQVTGQDIGNWTVAQEGSGTVISVDQAQAGDLYFWGSQGATYHVAIAAGDGQYIHAPQPGQNVTYGSTQYYAPDFAMQVNY